MKIQIVASIFLLAVGVVSTEQNQSKKDKRGLYYLGYDHGAENYGSQISGDDSQNSNHVKPKYQGVKVETYLRQEFKVAVPQPYPEYIEKKIPVPYSVEVPAPVDNPIPVPIIAPYPVYVQKHLPYPVEKNIPIPVKVPVNVPYPVKVAVPVEKPYLVHVTKNIPYNIRQPFYVDRHIPVFVKYQQHHHYEGYVYV